MEDKERYKRELDHLEQIERFRGALEAIRELAKAQFNEDIEELADRALNGWTILHVVHEDDAETRH